MSSRFAVALLGAAMFVASPVWADTWNFDSPTGPLGTSQTYTSGGITITASGWAGTNTPTNLYGKLAGGNENGLGLASYPNFEINTQSFINLDLTNLANQGIFTGQLVIGSVQAGEGYKICFGSAPGNLGTVSSCFTGSLDNTPFTIDWSQGPFVGITATSGNVLVGSLAANSVVPEPATLTLLAPGALLLGLLRRRIASRT